MNTGFNSGRVFAILVWLIHVTAIASVAQTVTLSPTSQSFGNQVLGTTSVVKKITLTNTQILPLNITGIATHLADYVATSTCPMSPAILAAGASCKISVTFTPSVLGLRTDTLSITDNASGSPQTVRLSGNGVVAVSLTPTSISFQKQVVGTTSSAATLTLKNNQTVPLTISAIATDLSDYSSTTTCPITPNTLGAGLSCTISVSFKPAAFDFDETNVSCRFRVFRMWFSGNEIETTVISLDALDNASFGLLMRDGNADGNFAPAG